MTYNKYYSEIGKLHVHRGTVVIDCRLPVMAYMTILYRLFPDEMIYHVEMENTMIAGNPSATVIEAYFDQWKFQHFKLPDGVDEIELPWLRDRWKDNFDHFTHAFEVKIFNKIR